MEESTLLLLKDLNNPNYKLEYVYNRPYITIETDSYIDTWSLTNGNGEYSYYIDEELYVYKLHREIKQSRLDIFNSKIKP